MKKKASDEQKKVVWDFEPIANKSQWCTFNFSSGSTGKPKIQIYKNQVTMKLLDNDNTGMKDIIGMRRGFKLLFKIIKFPLFNLVILIGILGHP